MGMSEPHLIFTFLNFSCPAHACSLCTGGGRQGQSIKPRGKKEPLHLYNKTIPIKKRTKLCYIETILVGIGYMHVLACMHATYI